MGGDGVQMCLHVIGKFAGDNIEQTSMHMVSSSTMYLFVFLVIRLIEWARRI